MRDWFRKFWRIVEKYNPDLLALIFLLKNYLYKYF